MTGFFRNFTGRHGGLWLHINSGRTFCYIRSVLIIPDYNYFEIKSKKLNMERLND
jgi:hypothetical protein